MIRHVQHAYKADPFRSLYPSLGLHLLSLSLSLPPAMRVRLSEQRRGAQRRMGRLTTLYILITLVLKANKVLGEAVLLNLLSGSEGGRGRNCEPLKNFESSLSVHLTARALLLLLLLAPR